MTKSQYNYTPFVSSKMDTLPCRHQFSASQYYKPEKSEFWPQVSYALFYQGFELDQAQWLENSGYDWAWVVLVNIGLTIK